MFGFGNKKSFGLSDSMYFVKYAKADIEGAKYFLPAYALHRPAVKAIKNGKMYEPATHDLVRKVLRERPGSMVHAGTFFGDMLPSFSKACNNFIYAFEPVLENYILAKMCIEENGLENVLLFNSALGSEVAVACIDTGADERQHKGGSSSISSSGQRTTTLTIDGLGIEKLSLIQLDVEGFELEALSGAKQSIETHRPIIMIEDNNKSCDPFLRSVCYEYQRDIPGLSIYVHSESDADKRIVS